MHGVGLTLHTMQNELPVGQSAVKSILDRTGLAINGFEKLLGHNREDLASCLNLLLGASRGSATIKVADKKVRAVHSARYSIIGGHRVYELAKEYFDKQWPNATFERAYWSHEINSVLWDLSAYTQAFCSVPLGGRKFTPALFVRSSDIAVSAVRLIPALKVQGQMIPLARAISTTHIGDEIEERVQNSFNQILTMFQDAQKDLQRLELVSLKCGYTTLLRVLKSVQMPKRQALEAADIFRQMYGTGSATAFEAYMSISDAYSFVVRDSPKNEARQFEAADAAARAIRADWEGLDLPGDFNW